MGQNSSRHSSLSNRAPATPPSNPNTVATNSPSPSAYSAHPSTQSSGQSRSSSVRRSLLNLIKPRPSSVRSRVDSVASTTRKSWRNSKRWSKAALGLSNVSESSSGDVGSTTPPVSSIAEKGQEKERDPETSSLDEPQEIVDRPSTPFPPASYEAASGPSELRLPSRLDPDLSHNIGNWLASQNGAGPNQEVDEVGSDQLSLPFISDDTPAASRVEEASSVPSEIPFGRDPVAAQENPITRQFPPPGTLVVVQGVVHTTDVPRLSAAASNPEPPTSSTPRPTTPSGSERSARNRLSALRRSRPTSMIFSNPSPTLESSPPSTAVVGPAPLDPASLDSNSADTLSDVSHTSRADSATEESVNLSPIEPSSQFSVQPANDTNGYGSGTISSSSIDVLGTLLSVAAAATAASLLTGSSDPILTSGLAPPSYNTNESSLNDVRPNFDHSPFAPPSADPWTSRPTSPTPTAGLGMGAGPETAAGRAERLRSAWGSIRERLGMRSGPNVPNASAIGNPLLDPYGDRSMDSPMTPSDPAPGDPREMMLAQMARAFNIGFGIAGETVTPQPREEASPTSDDNRSDAASASGHDAGLQLPPEGSFERFLVDLQSELRVALTNPDRPPTQDAGADIEPSISASRSEPAPSASEPVTSSPSVSQNVTGAYEDNVSRDSGSRPSYDLSDPESDSELESEHDNAHSEDEDSLSLDGRSHQQLPFTGDHGYPEWPNPARDTADGGSALPDTRDPRDGFAPGSGSPGRINWWRLYRFPPISPLRTHGVGVMNFAPHSSQTSSTTMNSSTSESQVQPEPPFGGSSAAPADRQTQPNSVVPVIVVGLQSVNTNWPQGEEGDMDMGGEPDQAAPALAEDMNLDGSSDPNNFQGDWGRSTRNSTAHGRGWQSRAASALRNLRPGRRNESRTAQSVNGPGSRTFLIYVIGGYYPPDHNIVTGGPNSLDSFEALLELAELLGQVKPPTASKEDIEKSGLEVISPSQLHQYEKDGKVSTNCTDQCLICLDEYKPEDAIRVMNCRHAFHKNCVDKWLETGKNNCPACRSRGVPSTTSMPTAGA